MRTIVTLTIMGVTAGAIVVAVQLNVFSPAPQPSVIVTPPAKEDNASAELLKRMEQLNDERNRADAAAQADYEALKRRLEKSGENQNDPLKW